MLFFYIRHGDPTYKPDELTPLGHRQAEAAAKRLSLFGLDRIFCSTSNRVKETALHTCQMLKKEPELVDFVNEKYAIRDFGITKEDGKRAWAFETPKYRVLFQSAEVAALGHRWYEHPELTAFKGGLERIDRECTAFFAALGYERIAGTSAFKAVAPTDERVALFAHAGFGLAFFSWLLHIPYPQFSTQFDLCHTGISAIEFEEENGLVYPKILTYSSDGHLYREGLPLSYNNRIRL